MIAVHQCHSRRTEPTDRETDGQHKIALPAPLLLPGAGTKKSDLMPLSKHGQ